MNELIAETKARLAPPTETVKSSETPAAPAPTDTAAEARRLWVELLSLEIKKKYGEALKKSEELMALPEKDRPAGLAKKIKDLKRGELFGEE